jgi:hypothetical protein
MTVAGHPLWHFLAAGIGTVVIFVGLRLAGRQSAPPPAVLPARPGQGAARRAVLGGFAAGSVAYVGVLWVLAQVTTLVAGPGRGAASAAILLVALASAAGAAIADPRPAPGAAVVVAAGAAWVGWGVVEQHIVHSLRLADGALLDATFHGLGIAVAAAGTLHAMRDRGRPATTPGQETSSGTWVGTSRSTTS